MARKKTMKQFIKENRSEIDTLIHAISGQKTRLNNEDREDWISNNEGLYRWAQSEGVDI